MGLRTCVSNLLPWDASNGPQLTFPEWLALTRWFSSRESACNTGDLGSILGSGRSPWRRDWPPTLVFLPEELHGQRNLLSYSPWGHKRFGEKATSPWRRKWQPSSVSLLGKSHRQRSLAGYSPRGRQESDTTERPRRAHLYGPHCLAWSADQQHGRPLGVFVETQDLRPPSQTFRYGWSCTLQNSCEGGDY